MIERRKAIVPDKISMINMIWMAMIGAMLTATVTLYQDKKDNTEFNYPQMTSRYQGSSYY